MPKHEITAADIMAMEDYAKVRKARRGQVTELKKNRRVHIGPDATIYFESFATIWHQIHEMLYIEHGGAAQIAAEIDAYNPLIPGGLELVATLMFEIDDEDRRAAFLAGLGGVEETVTISINGETIRGIPETDVDRTNAEGKASSIQFIHLPFTARQIKAFKAAGAEVTLAIGHDKYAHMAKLPENVRAALADDFD